jgi:hypothetical protein
VAVAHFARVERETLQRRGAARKSAPSKPGAVSEPLEKQLFVCEKMSSFFVFFRMAKGMTNLIFWAHGVAIDRTSAT